MEVQIDISVREDFAVQGARSHACDSGTAGFGSARPGRVQPEEGGRSDQQDAEERGRERGEQREPAVDGLVVKEAIVGEGPTMKRMMTRARGSGSRILKRSSHIRIILTDEIEIKTRETRKARAEEGEERRGERKQREKTEAKRRNRNRKPKEDTKARK